MKQLLWVSSAENLAALDTLLEQEIIITTIDIGQMRKLTNVAKSKTVADMQYIVIDLLHYDYDIDDLRTGIGIMHRISRADIIFVYPADVQGIDELTGFLAREGIKQFVQCSADTDLAAALLSCMGDVPTFPDNITTIQRGISAEIQAAYKPFAIPDGKTITIAAAGTMPRIGATTQAIMLCWYIKSFGASALYVDSGGEVCRTVEMAYTDQMQNHNGYYTLDSGLRMGRARLPDAESGAQIIDMGTLSADTLEDFMQADIRILVCGSKPWELVHLADAQRLLGNTEYITLVNLTDPVTYRYFSRFFGAASGEVPYTPDLFGIPSPAAPAACETYDRLVLPALQRVCSDG